MTIPDTCGKLADLGLSTAASLIRNKDVTSVELTEALLQRIGLTDARLRAWEYVDGNGARADARQRDSTVPSGPLHGVPVGIKDLIDVNGMPTTQGWRWPSRTPPVPEEDASVVRRLRAAGAIILGKTVTTPFAGPDISKTFNPWNLDRTPGGSSSGSAAAVASGQVPAALGTQTVGSVLRPAAYCGVVGFKPTFGAVCTRGVFPMAWSLDHVGILTRSVLDAAVMFDAISDVPNCVSLLEHNEFSWRPRIAIQTDMLALADEQTQLSIKSTVDLCRSSGADITFVSSPESLDHVLNVFGPLWLAELYAVHEEEFRGRGSEYPPTLRTLIELGSVISASTYLKTRRLLSPIKSRFAAMFAQYDALLSPVVPTTAPSRTTTGDYRFQATWSVLGVPAISLPTGWDGKQLPSAIQLASGHGRDRDLLRVARWIEALMPNKRGIAIP